ncbi:MAG: phage tail protein [Acidimicrobiia bacterium]
MSARGTIPELRSAVPLATLLPAIFQEDEMACRLTAGFDAVLAPVISVLDNLAAYVDPGEAPDDHVDWLAGWVGLAVDENWPIERRRALVTRAVDMYRHRGTARGLQAELELYTGGTVDVGESGGVTTSRTPGGPIPGEEEPRLAVRITVDDPSTLNRAGIEALVRSAKPAHVVHHVEIVSRGGTGGDR